MEPPCEEAMKNAIHRLQDIGALDEKGVNVIFAFKLYVMHVCLWWSSFYWNFW